MQLGGVHGPLLFLASRIGKKSLAKTKHNKKGGKSKGEVWCQFRLRSGFESINQYKGKSKGVDDKKYIVRWIGTMGDEK